MNPLAFFIGAVATFVLFILCAASYNVGQQNIAEQCRLTGRFAIGGKAYECKEHS